MNSFLSALRAARTGVFGLALAASLALPAGPALAAATNIAQVPILNIDGTGSVKPNLMLLYDNSGSMAQNYTPDFVNDATSCRGKSLMSSGAVACAMGYPPFTSADFNKQYYNPNVLYTPPVYADGTSYQSLNRANTTAWTSVTTDAYGVNTTNMSGSTTSKTNLVTTYPDVKWCDKNKANCAYNSATYTYPTDTLYTAVAFNTNPYYYNIMVAEYCTTANLTTCQTVPVGGAAPAGYTFPAKVRYCTTTALTTCQAKYLATGTTKYIYPRFSNPNAGVVAAYGTLTVGATSNNKSTTIASVSVTESTGTVVITNGAVTASGSTNTTAEMTQMANDVAASIIAKTGLTNQYTACVLTPSSSSVPACSTYGITLGAANIVAIVPIDCTPNATSKAIGQCSLLSDGTRNGWAVTAVSSVIPVTTTPIGAGAAVFVRVDIIPSRTNYPKGDNRTDCASTFCSYDEEMTNFANWYGYYKTRNQMMKTAVGQAFQPLTDGYSVGITSLSVAAAQGTMTRPRPFTGDARTAWYAALYAMDGNSSTPLRPALHAVGKLFANISPYVQSVGDEVVLYPCQQNFTFLTTDGYWNGAAAADVVSNDNVADPTRFCTVAKGCVDTRSQTANSLADVALYWYNGGSNNTVSSLRPSLEDMTKTGLVPGAAGENNRLHMNTYTLGLGVDGIMNYEDKYDTAPTPGGDFSNLINGVQTGCPWNGNGPYVWPDPATSDANTSTVQERVDDLWHTAINGHGRYFSASDPTSVVTGLRSALSNIATRVGAASSAATSTPNLTQSDDDIFSNTFTTVKWYGVMTDKKVDLTTGLVINTEIWNTSNTVGKLVGSATDTRKIYMLNATSKVLQSFDYSLMTATEKAWFDNQCTKLAQCPSLLTADRATVNAGANIVGWLRGQQQYANDTLLRAYTQTAVAPPGMSTTIPIVLGDIASSKPAYVRDPRKYYVDPAYATYKTNNANRAARVYIAANDGMLHAFDGTNGNEVWAYVPRITMSKLAAQASTGYGTNHQYTTDGSPEVADVKYKGAWRSVLIAGFNGGGRGYYAIDVTDPNNPVGMWETCADKTVCTGVNNEPEMGLTFGNPQMGTWTDAGGVSHWVAFVASGYNNVPGADNVAAAGTGAGWLMILDIDTGAVLGKVSTGSGSTTTPSGFARITGITNSPTTDPQITYIYGGDNLGTMWRFDLTKPGLPSVVALANGGTLQPITTRPDVTQCAVVTAGVNGAAATTSNKVVIAYGTGRLLDVSDVANTDTQSVYVVRDSPTPISPFRAANMAKQTLLKTTSSSGDVYTMSGTAVDLSTQMGWYVDLNQNTGERVNLDVKIVTGSLNVVTNVPTASSACSVGGKSNVYAFDVCAATGDTSVADPSAGTGTGTGGTTTNTVYQGQVGSTLSSTAAAVGYIIVSLPNGQKKLIATLADGTPVTAKAGDTKDPVSRRSGWRRVQN